MRPGMLGRLLWSSQRVHRCPCKGKDTRDHAFNVDSGEVCLQWIIQKTIMDYHHGFVTALTVLTSLSHHLSYVAVHEQAATQMVEVRAPEQHQSREARSEACVEVNAHAGHAIAQKARARCGRCGM